MSLDQKGSRLRERRFIALSDCEIKFAAGELHKIGGYASVFNGVDSHLDTVAPGAYSKSIATWAAKMAKGQWLPMRDEHFGPVIGKWTALKEDSKGLHVEGELTPDHSRASDVYASLKHGAVSGLSIGYKTIDAELQPGGRRRLKEIQLFEISVVGMPSDDSARADDIRNDDIDQINSLSDAELFLREAGPFSRKTATAFVSLVKRLSQREADGGETVALLKRAAMTLNPRS